MIKCKEGISFPLFSLFSRDSKGFLKKTSSKNTRLHEFLRHFLFSRKLLQYKHIHPPEQLFVTYLSRINIDMTNFFVRLRELLDELVRQSFIGSDSKLGFEWKAWQKNHY